MCVSVWIWYWCWLVRHWSTTYDDPQKIVIRAIVSETTRCDAFWLRHNWRTMFALTFWHRLFLCLYHHPYWNLKFLTKSKSFHSLSYTIFLSGGKLKKKRPSPAPHKFTQFTVWSISLQSLLLNTAITQNWITFSSTHWTYASVSLINFTISRSIDSFMFTFVLLITQFRPRNIVNFSQISIFTTCAFRLLHSQFRNTHIMDSSWVRMCARTKHWTKSSKSFLN